MAIVELTNPSLSRCPPARSAVRRSCSTCAPRIEVGSINLEGTESNAQGIGARVTLTTGGTTQTRDVTSASGYLSQNSQLVHFGLGTESFVDELRVDWPSGAVQTFTDVGGYVVFTVTEP